MPIPERARQIQARGSRPEYSEGHRSHHTPYWKKMRKMSKFKQMKLLFVCIFLTVATLGLLIALCVVIAQNQEEEIVVSDTEELDTKEAVIEACETQTCHMISQSILESMNTSADPCHNFYQYACGGFLVKHRVPAENLKYDALDILGEKIAEKLAGDLINATNEVHPKAVIDAAIFYQGCVDKETREKRGHDPLRKLLNELGGWPYVDPKWTVAGYQWHKILPKVIRTLGISPIISVSVRPDQKDTSQHIIYLDQPRFWIKRDTLILTEYLSHPRSQIYMTINVIYRRVVRKTALVLDPKLKSGDEHDEIVDFEVSLAKLTSPEGEMRMASECDKMTVAEAQKVTENESFKWVDFLNDVFRDISQVTEKTMIIICETNYIKAALKLISETEPRYFHGHRSEELPVLIRPPAALHRIRKNSTTRHPYCVQLTKCLTDRFAESFIPTTSKLCNPLPANYIGWRVISEIAHDTMPEFRENIYYFVQLGKGISYDFDQDLERPCMDAVLKFWGPAVGRLYVEKYFSEEESHNVDKVIEEIRYAYSLSIERSTWMDEDTKIKALDKLKSMVNVIGYPSWIRNDTALNDYYKMAQNLKIDEFFESSVKVRTAVAANALDKLNRPASKTAEWPTDPLTVNAFYTLNANTITVPAGILNLPFLKHDGLQVLNFGGIGSVIAREISHAFGRRGLPFDGEGNLRNWRWSKETSDNLSKRERCFEKQYSSFEDPRVFEKLRGNQTFEEDMADNDGLKNAFIAYKMHKLLSEGAGAMNIERLPNIDATPEQLFFIGFATSWCRNYRLGPLLDRLLYGSYSSNFFRVTVPLTNSRTFSEAFNCPLGSPMNPEAKCVPW